MQPPYRCRPSGDLCHRNGHRESLLIHRTLKSVYASIELAERAKIPCELVVVLDRGDQETRRYIDQFPTQRHRTIEIDIGDPGVARNVGAQHVRGKYVAYLDADDLFCPQWLLLAYKYAEKVRLPRLILHPEYNAYFESINCLVKYGSCPKPDASPLGMAIVNYWTSIIFLQRSLLADRQFPHLDHDSGFGYEDWHFIAEQVGARVPRYILCQAHATLCDGSTIIRCLPVTHNPKHSFRLPNCSIRLQSLRKRPRRSRRLQRFTDTPNSSVKLIVCSGSLCQGVFKRPFRNQRQRPRHNRPLLSRPAALFTRLSRKYFHPPNNSR